MASRLQYIIQAKCLTGKITAEGLVKVKSPRQTSMRWRVSRAQLSVGARGLCLQVEWPPTRRGTALAYPPRSQQALPAPDIVGLHSVLLPPGLQMNAGPAGSEPDRAVREVAVETVTCHHVHRPETGARQAADI